MRNIKGQFVKGIVPFNKIDKPRVKNCVKCSAELIKRPTESWHAWDKHKICKNCNSYKKGSTPWTKGRKRPEIQTWLKDVQFQKGHTPHNAGKPFLKMRGENHPNWKGGINPINDTIRHSLEIKLWRKAVFEGDNYTCKVCNKRGGELQADHIKPFALFPELRFELNNGRTLCKPCHRKTDTYGDLRHYKIDKS